MTTRLASTVAELLAAARAAAPGDVIQLAAGDYPGVSLRDVVKAEPGVVVEPQAGAAVTLALGLSACAGFTFRGLTLVVDPRTKLCANVFNSDRVAFEDVEGHGDLGLIDNGITVINLRASRQVAVRRARIHHALCGVQHIDCVGLEVSDSTFTLLSLDGVRGASDECDVLRNVFHDFHEIGRAHV